MCTRVRNGMEPPRGRGVKRGAGISVRRNNCAWYIRCVRFGNTLLLVCQHGMYVEKIHIVLYTKYVYIFNHAKYSLSLSLSVYL